ncbi:MAG: leucine-rich repeat domain-containing protein, partial [Pseudomonadales bacterium]|nr:leucine-rich repeat domain-containing protein [Pseudomonadales bacterium]
MLNSVHSSLSEITRNYFNSNTTYRCALNAIAFVGQFFKNNLVVTSAVTLGGICISGLVYYLASSSDEETSVTESDEEMTEITLIKTQSLADKETTPRDLFLKEIEKWIETQPHLSKEQPAQITKKIMECYDSKNRYDDTRCTTLHLSGYNLSSLPECIGHLSALTTLYLDRNQLQELPNSIVELSNLKVLDLSDNQLK